MELALGVDRGRVCLAEGTARSRVLRWERVQQVGGMKEDGCGWVYWVRSPRVLQTHLGSHPRLQGRAVQCKEAKASAGQTEGCAGVCTQIPTSGGWVTGVAASPHSLGFKAAPGPQPKVEVLKLQGTAE